MTRRVTTILPRLRTIDPRHTPGEKATGLDARGLHLLWVMRSPIFVRNHEAVLRVLAERGHTVHVAFEREKEDVEDQTALIMRLIEEYPTITMGSAPVMKGLRALLHRRARSGIDYLRYFQPAYRDADALRRRAAIHAPPGMPLLEGTLRRRSGFRRRVARALTAAGRLPVPDGRMKSLLDAQRPDVLIVTPLMHFGSPQPDYVRLGRQRGVPTALVTFSWDNFTNKTLMHEVPDLVTVWNSIQASEAKQHHGVPNERIEITGAPAYDHWFTWRPYRDRREFCSAIGLDPGRPYLLYACSSRFIAPDEPSWVSEWLSALRSAPAPLRDAGVVVRPHPLNAEVWRGRALEAAGRLVVFPSAGADPTDDRARADYFDSIFHAAAVVGVNTSALVESAILGRSTYTVRTDRYRATQEGTLHFHHLRSDRDGPVHLARTLDEHVAQLGAAVRDDTEELVRLKAFVRRFVRPNGLDEPAAPRVAAALEAVAARRVS
jgi:hypothetical protein